MFHAETFYFRHLADAVIQRNFKTKEEIQSLVFDFYKGEKNTKHVFK